MGPASTSCRGTVGGGGAGRREGIGRDGETTDGGMGEMRGVMAAGRPAPEEAPLIGEWASTSSVALFAAISASPGGEVVRAGEIPPEEVALIGERSSASSVAHFSASSASPCSGSANGLDVGVVVVGVVLTGESNGEV